MSGSLKTNFLFIGLHLTVNEVCHERNQNMKSDYILVDFKKTKKYETISKKLDLN